MARGYQLQLSKEKAAAKKSKGPQEGKSNLGVAREKVGTKRERGAILEFSRFELSYLVGTTRPDPLVKKNRSIESFFFLFFKQGMKAPCPICKQPLVDYFQLKQHYDTKHPKADYPPPS